MKIECTIDKITQTLNVNSNKPLNLILNEDITPGKNLSHCDGDLCGNCIVMIDDKAVLSCLIPAFLIKGKQITTFDGYRKTRFWHDIERAYDDTHLHPCSHCFSSKTLILESLLQQIVKTENIHHHGFDEAKERISTSASRAANALHTSNRCCLIHTTPPIVV